MHFKTVFFGPSQLIIQINSSIKWQIFINVNLPHSCFKQVFFPSRKGFLSFCVVCFLFCAWREAADNEKKTLKLFLKEQFWHIDACILFTVGDYKPVYVISSWSYNVQQHKEIEFRWLRPVLSAFLSFFLFQLGEMLQQRTLCCVLTPWRHILVCSQQYTYTQTHTESVVGDWNSIAEALLHVRIPPLSQHCLL